jgi:uncharacterized membrane protein YcaP (DUF421 family)
MKPEQIHLNDWMRILVGEVPVSFLLEGALRIFVLYVIILFSMRMMGKRMGSMVTRNEMIALVSLAAANGVAIQAPDRGLLPALLVSLIIVGFQVFISRGSMKSKKFESLVLDDLDTLVADGRLQLACMERTRLTHERMLAEFRSKGIDNLGRVQRTYMEANGKFTVMQFSDSQVGLSTLPAWDQEFRREQQTAEGYFACANCGNVVQAHHTPEHKCDQCGYQGWQAAVYS